MFTTSSTYRRSARSDVAVIIVVVVVVVVVVIVAVVVVTVTVVIVVVIAVTVVVIVIVIVIYLIKLSLTSSEWLSVHYFLLRKGILYRMSFQKANVIAEPEPEIRTRSGYKPSDCLKAFTMALSESGLVNTGKALHFATDLVCSGGYDIWIKALWDFAIEHVGIGSPRIFVYLKKRVSELDALVSRLDEDNLWKDDEFQTRVCELIFVLKECPLRTRTPWPKVGPETHRDGWLRAVSTNATETQVVKRVFNPSSDLYPLHIVGCEVLKACSEAATEKAFFWIRWVIDEDIRLRKENNGSGLSTLDRGPANLNSKQRNDVGYYLLQLFVEGYKEYAAKNMIRMSEEFQALSDLYRGTDKRVGAKGRRDILALMAQILCEVPRWKVPAAPPLIKDPASMSRAIQQAPNFFKEVLQHPRVSIPGNKSIFTTGKQTQTQKEKAKQGASMDNKFQAFDAAMEAYLSK